MTEVPIELIITAVVGGLVGLGIPKLMDKWLGHKTAQQESAMAMLRFVLEAQIETGKEQTKHLVELLAATRSNTGSIEALAMIIQSQNRTHRPPEPVEYDTPPIGALGPANE